MTMRRWQRLLARNNGKPVKARRPLTVAEKERLREEADTKHMRKRLLRDLARAGAGIKIVDGKYFMRQNKYEYKTKTKNVGPDATKEWKVKEAEIVETLLQADTFDQAVGLAHAMLPKEAGECSCS